MGDAKIIVRQVGNVLQYLIEAGGYEIELSITGHQSLLNKIGDISSETITGELRTLYVNKTGE